MRAPGPILSAKPSRVAIEGLSGLRILPGSEPLAAAHSGHQ